MGDVNQFKIEPSNYLGVQYSAFKSDLLQLALTNPSEYYLARKNILYNLKMQTVKGIYDMYYNMLTTGTDGDGNPITEAPKAQGGKPAGQAVKAETAAIFNGIGMPFQEVSEIALKATKTMDKITEEILELILPSNFKELADSRTSKKQEGTGIL